MACFTREECIKPWFARFSINASLEAPDDRHAMLTLLRAVVVTWFPILFELLNRFGNRRPTVNADTRASKAASVILEFVLNCAWSKYDGGLLCWIYLSERNLAGWRCMVEVYMELTELLRYVNLNRA